MTVSLYVHSKDNELPERWQPSYGNGEGACFGSPKGSKRVPGNIQLTNDEFENLRFHFGTSSWGGRRVMPYAFTGSRDMN